MRAHDLRDMELLILTVGTTQTAVAAAAVLPVLRCCLCCAAASAVLLTLTRALAHRVGQHHDELPEPCLQKLAEHVESAAALDPISSQFPRSAPQTTVPIWKCNLPTAWP